MSCISIFQNGKKKTHREYAEESGKILNFLSQPREIFFKKDPIYENKRVYNFNKMYGRIPENF